MKKKFFVFLGMSILLALLLVGCTDGLSDNLMLNTETVPVQGNPSGGPNNGFPLATTVTINGSDNIRATLNRNVYDTAWGRNEVVGLNPIQDGLNDVRVDDYIDFYLEGFSEEALVKEVIKARTPYKFVADPVATLTWKRVVIRYDEENERQTITTNFGADRLSTTLQAGLKDSGRPLLLDDDVTVTLTIVWTYQYYDSEEEARKPEDAVPAAKTTNGTTTWTSPDIKFIINPKDRN